MRRQKKRREISALHVIAFLAIFTVIAPYLLYLLFVFIARIVEIANDIEYYILVFRSVTFVGLWITLLFAAWFFVLPVILFAFRRIRCYLSLFFICRKNGFKMKLRRLPFSSLFGPNSGGDIEIIGSGESFSLHFIDVVFRAHRGFNLISDKEYSITKRAPSHGIWGGGLNGARFLFPIAISYSSMPISYTVRSFPEFDTQKSKHIIIVHPTPNHCVFTDRSAGEDGTRPIYNGYSIGNITYYGINGFLKFLKRI